MARNFELTLPSWAFLPDDSAELVAGDAACGADSFMGRPVLSFDDTDEEAALSTPFEMPSGYTGSGTLKATCHFFMASDATNDIALDIFVEAITPNSDTLDMEAADSWDTANSGTVSLSGSTAGDLLTLTITLTNKDSVAAGDLMRLGVRRDCDSANDDATGDLYLLGIVLFEEV